ncbi:MAG: hypothetical protein WD002_14835 [Pseudomonadales bacterium]
MTIVYVVNLHRGDDDVGITSHVTGLLTLREWKMKVISLKD